MALDSRLTVRAQCTHTDALDLGTVTLPLDFNWTDRLRTGTGADQANMLWTDTRTIAASGDEDLDLAGVLVDAFGDTLTFARIKGLIVAAAAGNTNDVEVSSDGSAGVPLFLALGDGITVRPGGVFAWFAPDATAVAVTATTGDLINIANSSSGTSVTYDIVIIGASA